jgi:hypothetical protein
MARVTGRLLMVAVALILAGCSNHVKSGPVPGIPGELGFECVWGSCPAESLAISRCASQPPDADAFRLCMRYEGYQALSCNAGTAGCTPKLRVTH